jgi:uncharacterized protein YlaI
MRVLTSNVILTYLCDECDETAEQPLSEIVESGTLICANDESYMVLSDYVDVQS